jgi:hypothetical protein
LTYGIEIIYKGNYEVEGFSEQVLSADKKPGFFLSYKADKVSLLNKIHFIPQFRSKTRFLWGFVLE